jgi:hypothetical protein
LQVERWQQERLRGSLEAIPRGPPHPRLWSNVGQHQKPPSGGGPWLAYPWAISAYGRGWRREATLVALPVFPFLPFVVWESTQRVRTLSRLFVEGGQAG